MTIDEIRKIPLVEFLNQLGYQPTGRDSKGLWFYSPYRNERKPSFHVNPRKMYGSILAAELVVTSLLSPGSYAIPANSCDRLNISPRK